MYTPHGTRNSRTLARFHETGTPNDDGKTRCKALSSMRSFELSSFFDLYSLDWPFYSITTLLGVLFRGRQVFRTRRLTLSGRTWASRRMAAEFPWVSVLFQFLMQYAMATMQLCKPASVTKQLTLHACARNDKIVIFLRVFCRGIPHWRIRAFKNTGSGKM